MRGKASKGSRERVGLPLPQPHPCLCEVSLGPGQDRERVHLASRDLGKPQALSDAAISGSFPGESPRHRGHPDVMLNYTSRRANDQETSAQTRRTGD